MLAGDCLLLARCRVVIEVHFQAIELGQFDNTPSSIVLPYLRSMTLVPLCDPTVLLRHLDLPVLTLLEIHDYEGGALLDDVVFNLSIHRTSPQFKQLIIQDIICPVEQTLAFFNMSGIRCIPDVFRVSRRSYLNLRRRRDMADKKFKGGPFALRYQVGWTFQPDMEIGDETARDWKSAFWDYHGSSSGSVGQPNFDHVHRWWSLRPKLPPDHLLICRMSTTPPASSRFSARSGTRQAFGATIILLRMPGRPLTAYADYSHGLC